MKDSKYNEIMERSKTNLTEKSINKEIKSKGWVK